MQPSPSLYRTPTGDLTPAARREWLVSRRYASTPAYRTYLLLFKPARFWAERARECGALVASAKEAA